ncbi:peptidoglycan recognition protein family protein [Ornithinibacillus halotolerans]|uniref:Autolysin n=1 Tax=Ornithinibacillus halotolerans TaxID=1274357 RepID=A0A916S6I6_9BACI|nr:peptidoglycan recognition family protein [Ornithinibacillus halotolerans]GGA86650.1 hypothetical protein GCM10008025_31900 [Ornithinibacillus halotolerans]
MKLRYILLFFIIFLLPSFQIEANNQPPNIYVVQQNDSLPRIAEKYRISVEELKLTNGIQRDTVNAGQKLWVPFTYEVMHGETLAEIAAKYRSTPEIIKQVNHLTSNQLYPGQLLKIMPKQMVMNGQHILMTKEEFKDWLFNQQVTREVNLIQQHHTWKPSYRHFKGNNHFQLLNSMQQFHRQTMKWNNIAQNITIFPDGRVAVSRPLNDAPEGTIGPIANRNGIAIENLGDFDIGQDQMTKEQKEAIVYVTAALALKFDLVPSIDTITYHHWWHYKTKERVLDHGKSYEVKSCPGTNFFGGNSTKSAKKNLYPLVLEKMKEIRDSTQ